MMDTRILRTTMLKAAGVAAAIAADTLIRRMTQYSFRSRVVVMTGGSRGLGLLMARRLASEGARLALCARDEAELQRAVQELSERGAMVTGFPCDITQPGAVEDFVAFARQSFGPIDVLIHNAGVIQVGPLETMTRDDFRSAMEVHFWAALRAIEAVLPDMRERRQGRIVNVSSIGGKIAVPHLLPYCASKFALTGLSEGLRSELMKDGIFVTTVIPGLMRTGSPRNAEFKGRHRAEYTWFSLGDSIPGLSMNADRAARQILEACRAGQAEVILSLPAKLAVRAHALAPNRTAALLQLQARLLPRPGGISTGIRKGFESESTWSPSLLTALNESAARKNNEVQPA